MRQAPTHNYLYLLILPFLLTFLWGCAPTTDTSTLLSTADTVSNVDLTADDSEATEPEHVEDEETPPEPEATAAEELQQLETLGEWESGSPYTPDEVNYDFPVTMNKQVKFYLDFFQNKQRETFAHWLERSTRFLPLVQEELRAAGLPQDLAYLPLIESGYSLNATSSANAAGPWQFMLSTARDYGLQVDQYVDERRDPEKSTKAAVNFLSNLYDTFGDWQLAVAAYNAGGGTISRGIKCYNSGNFWELAQENYLPNETKRYVPKLIAAIIIAKNPEKFGFTDLNYDSPLAYETIVVPPKTSLRAVEVASKVSLDELKRLNRNLTQLITPPYVEKFELKVPVGQKTLIAENLPRVRETFTTNYKTHIVRGKENLTKICNLYNVNKLTLLKANNLRKSKLTKGQRLRIPYQIAHYALLDEKTVQHENPESRVVLHKVKRGETISLIANKYNVTPKLIADWNGIRKVNQIKVGQQLSIYVNRSDPNSTVTLLSARTKVKKQPSTNAKPVGYAVQPRDTLWTIAQRFDITAEQLRQWNNLDSDIIHPGIRLQVSDPEITGRLSMAIEK